MSATKTESHLLTQSVMQREPLRLTTSDTIQTALEAMVQNHVSALPVVDEERQLIGIVSLSDLLPIGEDGWSDTIAAAMTGVPVTIRADDPITEAARLMIVHQVHHLPVVNKEMQLVGIVSSIDFVRLTVDGMLKPAN